MNEEVVGTELVAASEIVEGWPHPEAADDVRRDLQTKLAADRPSPVESWQIDLPAHDHCDELIGT